jgi:ATP-dependent Clp protease ATP-binding subunit ClpA
VSGLSRELELTIQAAFREALDRRHSYLTVEHLLYAVLHDERGVGILRACGANLRALRAALQRFFDEDLEKEPGDAPVEGRQTLAFHRVVQRTLHHVVGAEKEEADAGDLLAAILQEPDSHAVALLREQGVSRLDVLRYVSHGITKDGSGPEPGGGPLG